MGVYETGAQICPLGVILVFTRILAHSNDRIFIDGYISLYDLMSEYIYNICILDYESCTACARSVDSLFKLCIIRISSPPVSIFTIISKYSVAYNIFVNQNKNFVCLNSLLFALINTHSAFLITPRPVARSFYVHWVIFNIQLFLWSQCVPHRAEKPVHLPSKICHNA